MASTALLLTKMPTMENMAVSTSKRIAAAINIKKLHAVAIHPTLNEKNLFTSSDMISVPPSEPRFHITMPVPVPRINPPKIAAIISSFTSMVQPFVRYKKADMLAIPIRLR